MKPAVGRAMLGAVAAMALAGCGSAGSGAANVARAVHADATDAGRAISRDAEAPALLVDRGDPNTVYLAETDLYRGECRFYVSADRGSTWRPEQAPTLDPYTLNCAMGTAAPQTIRAELSQAPDGSL